MDPSIEFGYAASSDSMIYVLDFQKFKIDHKVKGHEGNVNDLSIDPFNKQLISCSNDNTFRIWT